jgi:hypothetical protein
MYRVLESDRAAGERPGARGSTMAISQRVLILAGGTAVLSIVFGIRLAMRAMAGGEASAASGSSAPDVAGVIALPPVIFLGFLAAAAVLEAVVPSPVLAAHAFPRYLAGAALAATGFVMIVMARGDFRPPAPTLRRTCRRRRWSSTASIGEPGTRSISD